MIRRPWLRIPPLALALFLATAAVAQAGGVRIAGIDTSGYPNLRVEVLAPAGSPAPTLHENGQPVTGLQAVDLGQAKTVVLAVDRSQSMRGQALDDAVAAARQFIAEKSPHDRVQVLAFGHDAISLTPFTTSAAIADGALTELRTDATPGTALWDSIVLASNHLAATGSGARVIVVLTDGHDVSSTASFADAIKAANAARASIYSIGIAGPSFTPQPLQTLAARTGGTYHEAASTTQLASIYASIGQTLARTWELTYPTSARPGDQVSLVAQVPGGGSAGLALVIPGSDTPGTTTVLSPSTWQAPWMPYAVSGGVGLLVLLACAFVFGARRGGWVKDRLEPHITYARRAVKNQRQRRRRAFLHSIVQTTERAFADVKQFRALERLLERADLPLRAGELIYICVGSGVLVGVISALVFDSPLLILGGTIAGAWLPVAFVKFKASMRLKLFDNQLADLLITISASLKAGHSFRHAIQTVVDEGAQPSAKEFSRVLSETQLGRPMDQALGDMADRVGSRNLRFVITAVTIQRQVGGSLAGLFDMVAETVRQRQQFTRKIRGLTAMGRMSAYVLIGLPFFIALAVTIMNPGYMAPLYHTSTGHMLIFIGLSMMAFGSVILRKMVSFTG
jgi:tight adherence protein B